MTAFLLEASEVETRLRAHILELIEPTIRKQGMIVSNQKELKAFMTQIRADVDSILAVHGQSDSLNTQIENFRVELSAWDTDRHEHEMQVSNRLSAQEVEINSLRQSLEMLKGVDRTGINRTLQNMGDMLTQYKDENMNLRRFCTERLDLNRDKISKLRDEVDTRTLAIENQMHKLQDTQTQTTTTIAHIDQLVTRMDSRVTSSCEGIADLHRAKASVNCLEELQSDMTEFMRHVNGVVSSLKLQFGSLVHDVKGHFETATQVVGRSTAEQMDTMRSRYQQDIRRVDVLRKEIEEFVSNSKGGLVKFATELEDTKEASQAAVAELTNSIEQLRRRRDVDQDNLQIDTSVLRSQIRQLQAVVAGTGADHSNGSGNESGSHGAQGGGFHMNADALATFVESAWMGLACDLQDEKDRKEIGLYGAKSAALPPEKDVGLPDILNQRNSAMSASPRKSTLVKKRMSKVGEVMGDVTEPVVSFDSRCLSCSGSMSTVLAGFKMACLRYEPGAVEYEGSTYSRSELVRKRAELLEQARAALKPSRAVD